MGTFQFQFKQTNGYPLLNQIEFLTLGFTRYREIVMILVSKNGQLTDEQKFTLLKDLIAIYNELEIYRPIKDELTLIPIDHPIAKFSPLFRAIRHLLAHFPFFKNWEDIRFNKDLVTSMTTNKGTIDKYFSNESNYQEFFFRFKDQNSENVLEGKIKSPVGYNNNDTVYLKDILALDDAITLIVGHSHMVLSLALDGNDLHIYD